QEVVLGRGGIKMLTAMGIEPSVLHLNEGHAAFAGVEWISTLMHTNGLSFDEARLLVRASTAFTTHTPVPAGHDRFGEDLVRAYFSHVGSYLQLDWQAFLNLGRGPNPEPDEPFNMTYLAMNLAGRVNGVSRIHGAVSRRLLAGVWPALLEREFPVGSVTNGIHLGTWVQPELAKLLGADARTVRPADFVGGLADVGDERLWELRQGARGKLIETLRERIERHGIQRGVPPAVLRGALAGLDPNALYIGFARRFAPYKRATLLFQDLQRLSAILSATDRPVRILIAGKAHPHDGRGQEMIHRIAGLCRSEALLGKVLLLEDYDMQLARTMLHGVDVWLNTPTRGDEASGTSGMKAAANGALNLSVPDGWWPEGYDGTNGWSLAEDRSYPNQARQDELDAAELYRLLESEITPAFFERDASGLPTAWLARMRRSLESLPTVFNTDRMVSDYVDFAYRDLGAAHAELAAEHQAGARRAAAELRRLSKGFANLSLHGSRVGPLDELHAGAEVQAQLDVRLGELSPEDVVVELVLDQPDQLQTLELTAVPQEEGLTSYVGSWKLARAGHFGAGLRLRPSRLDLFASAQAGLILWS
ncbi:MAG: alpha-glucan family phosphorylase, partial [Myxococcales bacterium]|nr:alpha-glucan family phosphorylase [Myxococcales bacterium]